MYSHDLSVHCEIYTYSRFCETKELKGENNSVLHSLFRLPPTTYWWASSCILGNQWLKHFHRVSAWLRVIWTLTEASYSQDEITTGSVNPRSPMRTERPRRWRSTLMTIRSGTAVTRTSLIVCSSDSSNSAISGNNNNNNNNNNKIINNNNSNK